jgi:hypothetical protein
MNSDISGRVMTIRHFRTPLSAARITARDDQSPWHPNSAGLLRSINIR